MSRRLSRPRAWFLGLLLWLSAPLLAQPLPNPLSLEDALASLAGSPLESADPDLFAGLLRRQPLYLQCHGLAYAGVPGEDPERNRPSSLLLSPAQARQLAVMGAFFDVLLADMAFASKSEAMAVAYIQFDRASVRRDLGQHSELHALELEARYEQIRHERAASQQAQQLTRLTLAALLGRRDALPRDLLQPSWKVPALDTLPPLDEQVSRSLDTAWVKGLLAGRPPVERTLLELETSLHLQELRLRLETLAAAAKRVRTESLWRDLKLDESRTLYEQEVTADLGYSMSRQTETRLLAQRVASCQALTWAELALLLGQSPLVAQRQGD